VLRRLERLLERERGGYVDAAQPLKPVQAKSTSAREIAREPETPSKKMDFGARALPILSFFFKGFLRPFMGKFAPPFL
jgi:hypothetical protein